MLDDNVTENDVLEEESEAEVEKEEVVSESSKDAEALKKALNGMRKVRTKERRIELLVTKASEERERQKRRRKAIRKSKSVLKEELDKTKLLRKYAGVDYERREVRAQKAIAGFFDLMNMCNEEGSNDFSEAYNFIGDTEWLVETMKKHTKFGMNGRYINIDRGLLRKEVLDKCEEIKKKIDDAEELLNSMLDEEEVK